MLHLYVSATTDLYSRTVVCACMCLGVCVCLCLICPPSLGVKSYFSAFVFLSQDYFQEK